MAERLALLPQDGAAGWTATDVSRSRVDTLLQRWSLACIVFSAFAARIWLPFVWRDTYWPLLSPVYRQQEHWLADGVHAAVVAHIACGTVMLMAATVQLDAPTRHARPSLHRWTGRLYVAAGAGALGALRWLRAASGAGSSPYGDPAMRAFIDASTAAWGAATLLAVDAIKRRRSVAAHARAMLLSAALAAQPILQRLLNALLLCPVAMGLRCITCLRQWGQPPWRARWGAPCGLRALLFEAAIGAPPGGVTAQAIEWGEAHLPMWTAPNGTTMIREGAQGRAALSCREAAAGDARASPRVFSLDGYGEAEQAAFGTSAWLSLVAILVAAATLNMRERAWHQSVQRGDGSAPGKHADEDVDVTDSCSGLGLCRRSQCSATYATCGGTLRDGRGGGNHCGGLAAEENGDAVVAALGAVGTLAPWRWFCACFVHPLVSTSRRLAGRMGNCACGWTGLRSITFTAALIAWAAILLALAVSALVAAAAAIVAAAAFVLALAVGAATVATVLCSMLSAALTTGMP